MYCCYTPDLIPGTPHAYFTEAQTDHTLAHNDLRPTSTRLAMDFARGAFTASGNYYLIKAAEFWDHISGLDVQTGAAINGSWRDGVFQTAAPRFDCLFLRGCIGDWAEIVCPAGSTIRLLLRSGRPEVTGAQCVPAEIGVYHVQVAGTRFQVRIVPENTASCKGEGEIT